MEGAAIGIAVLLYLALQAFLASRVFWDAQRRGLNARKWRLIVFLIPLGCIVYLWRRALS